MAAPSHPLLCKRLPFQRWEGEFGCLLASPPLRLGLLSLLFPLLLGKLLLRTWLQLLLPIHTPHREGVIDHEAAQHMRGHFTMQTPVPVQPSQLPPDNEKHHLTVKGSLMM